MKLSRLYWHMTDNQRPLEMWEQKLVCMLVGAIGAMFVSIAFLIV